MRALAILPASKQERGREMTSGEGLSAPAAATTDSPASARRAASVLPLSCIAIGLLVLMARRTDQLMDPQVWAEEGVQIIPSFLEHGPSAFLTPVNGFLVTTPRMISFLALALGGLEHYPGVSTAFGLLLTGAVFAWIGTAPLILRGNALLPLAVALVPSDVEVFVVPLLTFWFAGLALFSLALWRPEDSSRLGARLAIAVVGGLSNPVVVLLAPVSVVKAIVTRARHEALVAAALVAPALLQLWLVHSLPRGATIPAAADAFVVVARFLGYPLLLGFTSEPSQGWIWAAGAMHAAALLAVLVPAQSRARRLALVGLFLLSAGSSILRHDPPTVMHPVLAGPRYFFFPFVFLSWVWLDVLLSARTPVARLLPATAAGLILLSASRHFNRRHAHLDWQGAVRELSLRGRARLPVHSNGSLEQQWELKLAQCGDRLCEAP